MALNPVAVLNALPTIAAREELLACCGSPAWAARVAAGRPFSTPGELHAAALAAWWCDTPVAGWLEAFAAHPRIGDVASLRSRFAATAGWCEGEQGAAVAAAPEATLHELKDWNDKFEARGAATAAATRDAHADLPPPNPAPPPLQARFGHIFIVCATGLSAAAALAALRARYDAAPAEELRRAAEEQAKITTLRLDKLLASLASGAPGAAAGRRTEVVGAHLAPAQPPAPAAPAAAPAGRLPLTTHVLDTARGVPARGVGVSLEAESTGGGGWVFVGRVVTDADGRAGAGLLPAGRGLQPGDSYRLSFDTGGYGCEFYPSVCVAFRVGPDGPPGGHLHVPLLLSPFGYTTYRGS